MSRMLFLSEYSCNICNKNIKNCVKSTRSFKFIYGNSFNTAGVYLTKLFNMFLLDKRTEVKAKKYLFRFKLNKIYFRGT